MRARPGWLAGWLASLAPLAELPTDAHRPSHPSPCNRLPPSPTPQVIAWGPAPCSGEMGFGIEAKSSTKPKLVEDLEGTAVLDIALGYATTLLLLDPAQPSPAGQVGAMLVGAPLPPLPEGVPQPDYVEKVAALEVYDPVEVTTVPPLPEAGGAGGKRKAGEGGAAGGAAAKKAKK